MEDRLENLKKTLITNNLDYLFITTPVNIRYLTGFVGTSETERETTLLISKNSATFFAPNLYQEEALNLKSKYLNVVITRERNSLLTDPVKTIPSGSIVGVESENLTLAEFNLLSNLNNLSYVQTQDLILSQRIIKGTAEIELIKYAVHITDIAFQRIKEILNYKMTEKEIGKILTEFMEEDGADGPAFDPIVASGENSALPHYITGNKKVEEGILLIDAGARYKGYCGDLTRTFYLGKPDKRFREMYNLVLDAQLKSLKQLKPGATEENLWKYTRSQLDRTAKFSEYFTHGLGHGVGLQIHEPPYLRKGYKGKIKEGMAITIEPGLYFPGWGGIRIEDYCLVTENGCEVLSQSPKDLKSLTII